MLHGHIVASTRRCGNLIARFTVTHVGSRPDRA